MKRLLARVWWVAALLLPSIQAESNSASLDAFLKDVRTLSAEFEQRTEGDLGLQTASGTLWLARPGRFRWDYRTPHVQQIIGDGKRVWHYDPELEQATVKPQDALLGATPTLLLSGAAEIAERYSVRELGTREGVSWVELKPRKEQGEYSELRLGFRDKELAAMELVDGFGGTTRLSFRNLHRNPGVDPGLFHFIAPQGVDIVGE